MFAPGVSGAVLYARRPYESSRPLSLCCRSAKVSPRNCSAILTPFWIGSSSQRRRSDERVGIKGESERDPSDACGEANNGREGNSGRRGKTFGDFHTTDEAGAAQDERARC